MIRSLPSLPGLGMSVSLEDRAPSPLPPLGHDISRPSSTSTQSSNVLRHQQQHQQQHNGGHNGGVNLPGMSALASVASAQSPQMRSFSGVSQAFSYGTASPTPTSVGGQGNSPPVCQNCQTSTTPLWRRDELGSVLCNACGLFLKLHGRPRPISLKTDVIKSRNRVKSSGQAIKKAAKALLNGHSRSEAGTPPPGLRRVSHKSSRGSDRSNSPISRAQTPAIHHPSAIAPQHMFDTTHIADHHHLSHSPSLPALHLRHASPGSTISLNDRHLEPPQTYDGLLQANTSLKTRVSELEVINGLFKGRVQELERAEYGQRQALEQSRLREDDLRRRLEELEHHVTELRRDSPGYNSAKRRLDNGLPNPADHSPPYSKRSRISDITQSSTYPDPPSAPPSV